MTVVQKDFRSNPGNTNENLENADGTNMVQNKICDGNVTPKPGIRKKNWWQNMRQISDTWE